MAGISNWNHDRGGRDTVLDTDDGRVFRTGAAGTRCFRDISAQFSEAEAVATAGLAIDLMPEIDREFPDIRRPQVKAGEEPLVTEAFLFAGGVPLATVRSHGEAYRKGASVSANLRSIGFKPPS